MSCTLELPYAVCDTVQQIPFWQLSVDHIMDVRKDVHYQVKHRLYNALDT